MWNCFDTAMVAFAIIDFATTAFTRANDGQGVLKIMDNLNVLRLLRLVRLARLVRIVRLIPELKAMVYLIHASMSSFLWTTVLMMILIFMWAVYFTEMRTELVIAEEDPGRIEKLDLHWGTMSDSMLTLFMAMMGGEDWAVFVDVFRPYSSFWVNVLFFCTYVAFSTLVVLNLVTGVFVDGAQQIIREERETDLLKLAAKAFEKADIDHEGVLTKEQFDVLMDDHIFDDFLVALGINEQDADKLFYILDDNGNGSLSWREFMRATLRLQGGAQANDLASLKHTVMTNQVVLIETLEKMQHGTCDLSQSLRRRSLPDQVKEE